MKVDNVITVSINIEDDEDINHVIIQEEEEEGSGWLQWIFWYFG